MPGADFFDAGPGLLLFIILASGTVYILLNMAMLEKSRMRINGEEIEGKFFLRGNKGDQVVTSPSYWKDKE